MAASWTYFPPFTSIFAQPPTRAIGVVVVGGAIAPDGGGTEPDGAPKQGRASFHLGLQPQLNDWSDELQSQHSIKSVIPC